MARVIDTPTGGGMMGPFEPLVLATLRDELPDTYAVLPNFQLAQERRAAFEYDFVVIGPAAAYVIEAKEWYGRLSGDDTEWLINGSKPRRCPMFLVNRKCQVLKSALGGIARDIWFQPLLVFPSATTNDLRGNWAKDAVKLLSLAEYLKDQSNLPRARDISNLHKPIIDVLQGQWGQRHHGRRRQIGSYEIVEVLHEDDRSGEYLGRHTLLSGDAARYRIRTWRLDQNQPPDEVEKQKSLITRPSQAVRKVGPHPNLLDVRHFEFNEDENEYVEVTDWSDFGTLHGYLNNPDRGSLTVRERLQIVHGVASALEAIHSENVVHRNVCPESIVIDVHHAARLTDFDRAHISGARTVFADTDLKKKNQAYLAPELRDITDYEVNPSADLYSLGVLLYEVLTGKLPFANIDDAIARDGKPERPASAFRDELDPGLDGLIEALLRVKDHHKRPTASDVLIRLDEVLHGESSRGATSPVATTPAPESSDVSIGETVDGKYRIDVELGRGFSSIVYRVWNFDHQRQYAMKLLKRGVGVDDDVIISEFSKIGDELPRHPNLARIIFSDRLVSKGNRPFVLSEFVDGETLESYCTGDKKLAWTDIKHIGCDLLDALSAFHPKSDELEQRQAAARKKTSLTATQFDDLRSLEEEVSHGILHRDIKPANILLELPSHRPKLIDFNIASTLGEAEGRGGTPQYWAPDRGRPWHPSADLFSLGVVLYELIVHQHPFNNKNPEDGEPLDPRVLAPDLHLSAEIAEFLLKATQPFTADRFRSASSMKEALLAVSTFHAPADPPPIEKAAAFPGITLMAEEKGRQNYNPYVTRLLTLYSQATRSNAGTRGLDEIARLTYVKTSLDEKLAPDIADGKFRLVVITGNAGDGKTAFLQEVERLFGTLGTKVERLGSNNGARWNHGGVAYETNYDGSQDEGDRASDDVLASFLEPFSGDTLTGLRGDVARLIAVNEGRLLDFLEHSAHKEKFNGLRDFVHRALDADGSLPAKALLVNLNLRSISVGGEHSLVEQQLQSLTQEQLWKPCATCSYKDKCPLKFNADTFRDPVSGGAVRARVRRLFEVVHLRRKAHMTMRDLRSALSWILLRDHSCDDVAKLNQGNQPDVRLADLAYTEAVSGRGKPGASGTDDRLVSVLREVDPGLVNAPRRDRRLDWSPDDAVPWMTFDGRALSRSTLLTTLTRDCARVGDDVDLVTLLAQRRQLAERWRRWAFYERRDDEWKSMLPYRSLDGLERVLMSGREQPADTDSVRDNVLTAISLSEGLRHNGLLSRYLGLRVSRTKKPTVRTFRLFDKSAFKLEVRDFGSLGKYLECSPDSVELVYTERGKAKLRISLDLLEMLDLIRTGYRPSPADLQGMFVNLLIFRNELMNLPFRSVVATQDDRELYEIKATADPGGFGVRLSLTKHDVSLNGSGT